MMTLDCHAHGHDDSRLNGAVAEYILAEESGNPPERSAFLARFPDLADELTDFLEDRDRVKGFLSPQHYDASTALLGLPLACPHCHHPLATTSTSATCPECGATFRLHEDAAGLPSLQAFGRFQLVGVLGRGGFATVYKAWDPATGRHVALKVPRKGGLVDHDERERFFREAKLAITLHHPGIVRCFEMSQADGTPWLASEFVEGGTLADLIKKQRPSFDAAAELIAFVADALQHAHGRGVIHRDVKPSNIMMRGGTVPLVADFGLACLDGAEPSITRYGIVCGTPAYMSPEQAKGDRYAISPRSDVYSAGVVLYELITGQQPFVGNARMILKQILDDEPRPPRRLNDRVPVDLETVCLKCLNKDPRDRYPSAADLAKDLRNFRDRKPVSVRRPTRRERIAKWARRNPALATAASLAGLLLVATAALTTGWGVHASGQAAKISQSLATSEQLRAEGYVDTGLSEARQGNVAAGLLWMARGIERAPASANDLQWVARSNMNAWRREIVPLTDCRVGPPGRVLAFAPDGASAWVVDSNGQDVQRWDVANCKLVGPRMSHPDRVTALCVSPSGDRIATGCQRDGQPVRIWDVRNETHPRELAVGGGTYGLAFFPDGNSILTAKIEIVPGAATQPRTVFQEWNLSTGHAVGLSFRHPEWIGAMALSSDRQTLYSVSNDFGKAIRRWNMAAAAFTLPDLSHPVPITALAVSADGRYLLTGGSDRLARLIEVGSGKTLVDLPHRSLVTALAFGPADESLLSASPRDAVRVWAAGARLKPPAALHGGWVRAVAVSPDGMQVATGCDDGIVRLWKIVNGTLVQTAQLPPDESAIASVIFAPDGKLLATSTHQRTGATLWDLTLNQKRCTLRHPERVHTVRFSNDGARVLTAAYESAVHVWNAVTGEEATQPLDHEDMVLAALFSPDGQTIVTAGKAGVVRRWNASDGTASGAHLVHAEGLTVKVIAFSPDGNKVLTAGENGIARQWDWLTGTPLGASLDHGYEIWTACYSEDGRFILTGGKDNTAQIWDAGTGRKVGHPLLHSDKIWAAGTSPGARWAFTASRDGTARVWELATGRALGPPLNHDDEVLCAAVAEHGRWLVTAGMDSTAKAWSAPREMNGPSSSFVLWAQVLTGAELDESGGIRPLGPREWADRRTSLEQLGGAPEE